MTEIYAVFDGYSEMPYGYPPNLLGLFATRGLAEEAVRVWKEQADREKAENPKEYRSTFEALYVVPVALQAEVGTMPVPGNVGIGLTEYLALSDEGKL